MYSREKRKKAIELYLKYDKSVATVIRELGYQTRKMLPRWYKEYLKEQETGIVRHLSEISLAIRLTCRQYDEARPERTEPFCTSVQSINDSLGKEEAL